MTPTRSCGLAIACALALARPSAPQEAQTQPPAYDLTLELALELARAQSPRLRAAEARVHEAEGRRVGAAVPVPTNPTLEIAGGPRFGPLETSLDFEVGVEQQFELGGRRAARIEATEAGIARAGAAAEEVLRDVLRDTAVAFLRARYAAERLRVAADSLRLAVELHEVAQRRHEAGDVGVLDVHLAALAVARDESAVRTFEVARDEAIGALRAAIGLEPDAAVTVRGDLLDRRRHELVELLERAPERADLRALEASARQADAEVRLGEAHRWPDLGLGVGYAREEQANLVLGTLSLTMPFFDRGQGLEAMARARREALRLERAAVGLEVTHRVRTAYDTYRRLLDAVEQFEADGLEPIEQVEALANRSYEAGAMRLGELLVIRRELVEARVTYVDLLMNAALAEIEIEAEAGLLR